METISKPKTTREAILEQLHENTGAHFLDSGSAYGRHWERNQAKTWDDLAKPTCTTEAHVYTHGDSPKLELMGWVKLAAWMEANLEYSPEMQERFEAFVQQNDPEGDEYDMTHMEDFAAMVHAGFHGSPRVTYTYGWDNDLTQDIQYIIFTAEDEDGWEEAYALVQVHQGCDARGGLGSPKAYKLENEFMPRMEIDMWGCDSHKWGEAGEPDDPATTLPLKDYPVVAFDCPNTMEQDLENLALTNGNTEANRALITTRAQTVRREAFEDFCETLEDETIVVFDRTAYFVGDSGPEEIWCDCSGPYN